MQGRGGHQRPMSVRPRGPSCSRQTRPTRCASAANTANFAWTRRRQSWYHHQCCARCSPPAEAFRLVPGRSHAAALPRGKESHRGRVRPRWPERPVSRRAANLARRFARDQRAPTRHEKWHVLLSLAVLDRSRKCANPEKFATPVAAATELGRFRRRTLVQSVALDAVHCTRCDVAPRAQKRTLLSSKTAAGIRRTGSNLHLE